MKEIIERRSPTQSIQDAQDSYVNGTTHGIEGREKPENYFLEHYTAHAEKEIDQLFPTLPNPKIKIYVYPHMATNLRAPVPGYVTAISLYERDEYALPNEMTRARTTVLSGSHSLPQ